MNRLLSTFPIMLALVSLSACSIAPGMPGLKTNASRYSKPQTEGVDYKLIVIDAEMLKSQKQFDYASYINDKKKKIDTFRFQSTAFKKNGNVEKALNNSQQQSARYSDQVNNDRSGENLNNANKGQRFEGITSGDNASNYQYLLGKGDVLNITVWDHPELSEPGVNGHIVGSDGRFYFPYSGKVNAAGKTVRGIRDELESKLGSFITKPQVSVSVVKYRSQKIYTSGALKQPSVLLLNDTPTTVRDAISQSGGLVPNQYTGYATLARNGRNISIDLNRMLKFNDNRQNFILRNGDRLNVVEKSELAEFNKNLNREIRKENVLNAVRLRNEVSNLKTTNPIKLKYTLEEQRSVAELKNQIEKELKLEETLKQAKVFVMGEVYKPGSVRYQITNGMTLAEAINDSGSFKEETVNTKGVFVIRREDKEKNIPTVYQLPIASVQSMFYAEQFQIRPRDIVYVTATPSIRWNRVIAQLLPSLAIVNTFRNFN